MKDLIKLYSFESIHGSDDEKNLADWIEAWLIAHDKPFTRNGNCLYNFENNCVILSAHLDQVKTKGKAVHFRMYKEQFIKAFNSKWEQTSLGADDKNGVWIILKALEANLDFDWVISDGEECGCIGINRLEQEKVLDVIDSSKQICLVLDRKGNADILKSGSTGDYCSTLAQDLCNFFEGSFKVSSGTLSDTSVLCKHCESVNMSVAYFNPHRSEEYTDFSNLEFIRDCVMEVIENFAHYPTDPSAYIKQIKTTYYDKNFNWSEFDDYKW